MLSQRSSAGTIETGGRVERHEVPIRELADFVSERANPERDREVTGAEVLLPRKLLKSGLTLIDSPGVGGLTSAHALTTLAALPSAHAMLFVSDASQEYTEPEIQFLRHAMRISPNVARPTSIRNGGRSRSSIGPISGRSIPTFRCSRSPRSCA